MSFQILGWRPVYQIEKSEKDGLMHWGYFTGSVDKKNTENCHIYLSKVMRAWSVICFWAGFAMLANQKPSKFVACWQQSLQGRPSWNVSATFKVDSYLTVSLYAHDA